MNKFNNADVKRKSSTKLKEFLKRILKNEEKVENLVARIHGGTEAKVGQFPWMVLVVNAVLGVQVSACFLYSEFLMSSVRHEMQ